MKETLVKYRRGEGTYEEDIRKCLMRHFQFRIRKIRLSAKNISRVLDVEHGLILLYSTPRIVPHVSLIFATKRRRSESFLVANHSIRRTTLTIADLKTLKLQGDLEMFAVSLPEGKEPQRTKKSL